MSELIVEKIAPQSEILDIKGKLKLQGNLETTGTFLSSYLNVKPNDLDISTVTINDTTGYGITFLTDNKTLELNRTNPNKGIKLHTIASSKNNSYFDTLTIGNIQGGKGSITITPDSPKGSPFSNQKDKIIINTSNLLVKDPNIPVSLSKRGNETTLAKASYNAISTGSILYLGSLPKGNKSLDITNEYVSGLYTGYRSIKPGAVVVRNNFHSIGGLTHIHGKLKVGMGTAELDGTTGGYLNLHHFTGNNSLGNLDEDYEGAIIIRSGKRDLTQAAILIAIRDGDYGEDIQDEYHSVIQELSEPISWNFENAILNYQAEYDISPQNIEYTFNEPTQVVDEEFINLFETIPETELIGVPLEYMWEDMYTGATTLEEAQNQALQDKFLNTDSEFYIGVDGHSGRDSQPNIISRGSLTIGLDGRKSIVGSERNSFFEIISGINDVENHADATTLFNINNVNKKTFVQHLSSSGQLFASMSDASTNSDDQLRQHVIVVDTASGQFFITGSYGGSSTEDGKKVGFPYSGSDVVVTNNPEGSQAVITGSLFLSGSGNITASGHISSSHFYGDLTGTASYVKTASYVIGDIEGTASWALNASESVSASFASSSNSASYATNATSADTASYVQNALTKFLSLTDVDTTFNYGAIGSDFESFTPQIGAMEAAPAFGITEDTVEGQFTGLPGFIPVVNSEGTKLQLSKKVASASFADNVKNATTAFTGGKFTQGNDNSQLPNLTTEGLSDKFQMPAGFHAHGLNSTIVGNLSISGSLGVSDSITIADIQISASDGAFSFGTGSDNTITHQMTGNLSLSASTGITVNMPSNVIGFHGTASYAKTASYAINGGEGGVGFPYSGSDVVVTGNPEGSQAVITGSLFLTSSGNITASGHISSSHFYGDLTGTASYATNASESVSASYAETASYVIGTIEGTASWALNASESVSASFASSSTSASYADTASYIFGTIEGTASWALNASESVSASFASSSTSASFASSSTSASFASSSTSASFASSSTSASFASSSTSASYAKTASYIIGDVEGTASWALNASESVSASFASTSFSASYAKNVSLNFTHLTDVPSGNGENDIAAIAAVNTYPNQTHNFAVVVDGEGTALAFVKAVKSASFASGSDSASYAQNATLAETASFASNVATKFTDLKDVDSSLTEDAANPEGDTNLSGLADYVIAVEPIGNKLRAVKTVKSASFAVRSFSASFASSSTSASFASSSTSASFALTSFSASFASSSDSASYAKTASYISSADVADLDFLDLEDTTDAYGNEGDVLVLESDTLIFKSASNSASFASSSNSASFASSSTSASFASSSTSASFASSSTSASFASSSTSASFASTSFSASYAIKSTTASYVIGDIEGTSSFAKTSSYAISGGFSESGFFAWKTLIQGDLTVSGSVGIVGGGLTINDIQVSSSQGGFTFGSGSENNINHQMTGNLQLSSSVGITANMPNNTVGFHGTASHASRSVSASYAETASYVIGTIEGTASWALNASESVSSSFASSSTSASFASSSTSASFASSSTSASFASSSTSASFASSSTSASFASSSTSASFASSSTSASYAKTASYVIGTIEGTASWALNASESVSASFASSSTSASFASSSTSASYAKTASYIIGDVEGTASYLESFLSMSDTPESYDNSGSFALQVAPNSNKVSFVKAVDSASFASGSDSASYAKSASYISASDIDGTIDTTFLDLTDTPATYIQNYALQATNASTLEFVKAVKSASFASSSTSASFASSSTSASFASSSNSASFASSSTSASFASSSTSASFASSSTSASFASTSFSASYASRSTTASYALNAQNAEGGSFPYSGSDVVVDSNPPGTQAVITGSLFLTSSGNITASGHISSSHFYGDLTGTASYAADASESVSASYAETASYIIGDVEGTASWALNASESVSASFASSSTSASFASSSTSASFASSSTSASFASSSTSASFASSSTSASFASSSTSASFASSSTSASYAKTASYIIGDVEGTASWALNASESVSASYASMSQEIYVNTTFGNTVAFQIGDKAEGTPTDAAPGGGTSGENLHPILFASDISKGKLNVANGNGYTDVGVTQSLRYDTYHERLLVKRFKSTLSTGTGFEGTASWADKVLSASFASSSTSASYASSSTSASFASSSTSASFASSSTSASFASSSTSASFASSSTSASFASSSTSASFASSSTSASYASQSETASYVESASFATLAISGGFSSKPFHVVNDLDVMGDIMVSGSVSIGAGLTISNVQISSSTDAFTFGTGSTNNITHQMTGNLELSASVGITANMSADTIGFHGTASWADKVLSASFASSSTSASFASSSTSASFASMSFSASFASTSFSASYAKTASYVIGDIEGTASWALNASESVSASFASSSTSASFASSSTSASFASSSTSASFASSSTSASFASTSFSASYAKTASYVIGDIEGTASWALNASESVSASFASSSTSASFASSSTSASFASMSFSASYASSSTSASYASSSTSASYANNTDKAERAVSASFASNSAEIFVTNYAKSALLNDNDKVHLTFVTKPDYNTTNPTITDDVPEGGVPYDAATMSKLYAFGQPAHKGLTYTPSEDLLHTTTSFALTASHALNASTNYIDLTDTEDTNYTDKSGFVPVVKENSTLPNDGVLTLLQTVPSASIAFSSSYALTASYVEGADGGNANTAETANTVLIVSEGEGFHRLIMVDQNNDFGDGEPESLQETDGLIWNGLERRLGINTFKPATELHLRGVEYIEGGTFQWTQHIPVSTPTGPNTVSVNTTLPNQIQNHPYNSGNINTNKHKPGIILPLGVGIYSIDTTNNNPTSPVNNGLLPWSNLITHREDKGVIDIGDPYSANMIDMNFYVGSRRSGNFYFNPHASTQPNLFDTTDPLGGPFSTSLNNPIPTLQIVQGKPISSNTSANTFHGSVGIRCRKGFLQDSTNALYVRGTTILGDSLVVNRMYSGNGIDTYDPKSPIPPTGVETLYNLAGPNHFEIHPPVETPSISSKFISAIRFKVDPDTMASTYQIDHQMDRSGYIIYNNATSQCDISFKTITTIPESLNPVVSGPIPTDRLHIDNLSGTVTIGATNFTNGYNWGLVGSGNVSENPPEHKKYKFVVNGPSLMNGNLIITGSSNSSGYNGKYLGYPLLKVDTMDTSDSGNFIVQFENKDITSPKILNLISHDKDARGATFISFKNIDPNGNETERGSIKSTTGGNTISYNTTSDRRLKTNIKSTNELDKLLELNPVTYNWKKGNTKDIGLIAQEVDEIYPHLVDKSNEETLQMNYIGLVPILLSGIKEQQKMIDSLEERIKKLENK